MTSSVMLGVGGGPSWAWLYKELRKVSEQNSTSSELLPVTSISADIHLNI